MRNVLSWVSFIAISFSVSCLESENINSPSQLANSESQSQSLTSDRLLVKNPFSKDVGDVIPVAHAQAWIKNYLSEPRSIHSEFLGNQILLRLIMQKGCTGISFQYGISKEEEQVILLVGVTGSGKKLNDVYVSGGLRCPEQCPDGTRYVFNENVGSVVTADYARPLTDAYVVKYPNDTRSHFFGSDLITQLLNQQRCVGLSIQYALDDSRKQQLILTGVDERGMLMQEGAFNSLDAVPGSNGDASFPCPATCPTE
jgi:hypothetical protein